MHEDLLALFPAMLARHVQKLVTRGDKVTGLCPFHPEKTPSFSANTAKGVYYCFGCGANGGVVAFARATGEPLPGRQVAPPLTYRTHSRDTAIKAEFLAWKANRYYAALVEFCEQEREVASLNRCFRFALSDSERATLHREVDDAAQELLDAIEQLDKYDINPLADTREAEAEFVAGISAA